MNGFDWDARAIATLRALWGEGHSTVEIARRMGTSKGSVIGKAHRLDLPARRSPIKTTSNGARTHIRVGYKSDRPGRTLNRLKGIDTLSRPTPAKAAPKIPALLGGAAALSAALVVAGKRVAVKSLPRVACAPAAPLSTKCLFPLWGHNERPTQKFCSKPATRHNYCSHHAAVCYGGPRLTEHSLKGQIALARAEAATAPPYKSGPLQW